MARIINLMPELEPDELNYIQSLVQNMSDAEAQQFANIYRSRRKDPQSILIMTILGFFLVAGIQRFYLGQILMGLLYFFTGGFCLVGTIIDLINHKRLAYEYNVSEAQNVLNMMRP